MTSGKRVLVTGATGGIGGAIREAFAGEGETVIATGRNAGFLLAESDCFELAASKSGEDAATALRDAGLRTRRVVRGLARRAPGLDLSWTGSIRLATDPEEAAHFAGSAARTRGVRSLQVGDVPEARGGGPYLGALEDVGDGMLHPLALLSALLEDAVRHGTARRDRTEVLGIEPRGGRVDVLTPRGTVRADRVVVATNSEARLLLGAVRPIRPVRGQVLVADVDPFPPWTRPVYATRGGDYWRPLPDGRVLLGGLRRLEARRENTRSLTTTATLQRHLRRLLARLLPDGTRVRVTHTWAGTMAFTPDHLPWVGPLPGARRISLLAGLNGHGMGWAPGLAEGLAASLEGEAGAVPACFSPARARR